MNNFLLDLALAHEKREGYYPGSLAYSHNNPGNLEAPDGTFLRFPTPSAGVVALERDLKAKITNNSASMNRYYATHKITYAQATMFDYVSVYAPPTSNDTVGYCAFLCERMKIYNLKPTTLLSQMTELINGTLRRAPDPPPATPIIPIHIEIANLQRREKMEPNPIIKFTIGRMIARLLSWL